MTSPRFEHYLSILWLASISAGVYAADPAVKSSGKLPEINQPVLLGTADADAIAAALQVFPPNNAWNTDISKWPVHPNSAAISRCATTPT
jgi:hypothetical protein